MPDSPRNKVYTFGSFRFDAGEALLLAGWRIVPLPPKALAPLGLLIRNRGRLMEKEALMKGLWPGTFVEEGNLAHHISTLRKLLGNDAIETVPWRGYRFTAEVKEASPLRAVTTRRWVGAAAIAVVSLAVAGGLLFHNRAQSSRRKQTEAFELCLKGRSCYWDKWTPDGLQRAIGYFEQARKVDPSCALAWAGLADCYSTGYWYGVRLPHSQAMQRAKNAAERALQLDPQLAQAHTSLGIVKFRYEWDWAGAEREYRAALRLNPKDSYSHAHYGVFLVALGRAKEAMDEITRAQQLDPLSPFIRLFTGVSLGLLRRPDQAIEAYRKALELDPTYTQAQQYLSYPYQVKGMYEQAVAQAIQGSRSPERALALRQGYEADGIRGFWRAQSRFAAQDNNSFALARYAARLGQLDESLRWLERAYEERRPEMPLIAAWPDFDPLRGDARFIGLMGRMGLPKQTPTASGG